MKFAHLGLLALLSGILFGCDRPSNDPPAFSQTMITVRGPVPVDSIGLTLIHEHVFLDWTGADSINPEVWEEEEAFQIILPFVEKMKKFGVQSFLECTPAYLGRNPMLLQRLSKATGLNILTNTGFYAARKNKYVPSFAFDASAGELANIWIDEYENGIGGTGIKPGFIKIGMDSKAPLTDMDQKLARAAARTHLKTGLTIVAHTGTDTTAAQELAILAEEGVAPDAFVWTHAQRGTPAGHVRLARMGAWVSLDGMGWIRPDSASRDSTALYNYIGFLENLKEYQLLGRTLISHDAGWYTVGKDNQDQYKPYSPIFEVVMPLLRKRGFTEAEFHQLLVLNPKEAYTIRIRKKNQLSHAHTH